MLREDAANPIFVDINAEGMRNLLRDAHTAKLRIAALHLDDGRNEFGGRAFRTGLASLHDGGEEPTVFVIDQGLVELQQRGGLENNGKFRDPPRIHKQRRQREQNTIERGEIRCAVLGSIRKTLARRPMAAN